MKTGLIIGFVLGAPIWFSAGAMLMGRLIKAAREQERRQTGAQWDWSRP